MKKKRDWLLVLLLYCSTLQNSFASHLETFEEILRFCSVNAHGYIALWIQDPNTCHPYMKSSSSYDVQIKFIEENLAMGNMDTLIIQKDMISLEFHDILEIMSTRKRQKSIVVATESEVGDFKTSARGFGKNSYVYLLTTSNQSRSFKWYTVMTFNDNEQFIMNEMSFDHLGKSIENYDYHGFEVVATGMSWKPSMAVENCDKIGRNCDIYGSQADLTNAVAKQYNFTWDIYKDLDNDWGMHPVEGPFNLSGKWKGVMGDVVTGKYQMSLNSWLWTTERNNVLEFVLPSRITTYVLCYIPKASELDYGLVIRPFTINVWMGIGIILIIGLAFFFVPYFFISGWDFMSANSLIKSSLWFFFVFINAYYGGALTMFFANDISPPFENLRDVLKAFPKWNLIFPSGLEMFFKVPAEQGDLDYIKFWSAVDTEVGYNKKHFMTNIQEGLKELEKSKTIMFIPRDLLKASYQDSNNFQRIKIFGASQTRNLGWIFTKNSPLVPLFKQAAMKMLENGEFRRAQLKWNGPDIISGERAHELEILSIGQLVLPFGIFGVFLVVSFIPLMIECCYKKITHMALTLLFH